MQMWNLLFEKMIAQEAPGGAFERLSVVAPSVVKAGEPFAIKLAGLDAKGYPSLECDGLTLLAECPGGEGLGKHVVFEPGKPALAQIDGVRISEPVTVRIPFATPDGAVHFSNPVRCEKAPTERIFWGDPHVHTVLSDCHPDRCRSLDFCFVAARYLTGLDWVCAADHVSNGRTSRGKWEAQRAAVALFDDPPSFATMLAYEASLKGGCGGDNNVYFAGDAEAWVDEFEDGDVRTLAEKLGDQEFFIVPHHTTRTGKHGELSDRTYVGREHMPVMEIHSKWGTSEYRGNPNALHEVHPGPSYAQDFLEQGYPLGFIAGTDTHATMPSGYGDESGHIDRQPGITAVFAPELSRRGVFSGIRHRNCYATSAERMLIDFEVAGARMGREIAWTDSNAPRQIEARVAARSDIMRVDVVRNGEDVFTLEPTSPHGASTWQTDLAWTDEADLAEIAFPARGGMPGQFVYYYLRLAASSGAQGWSSPVWLLL